jgi:hypothetical protein
LEAIIWTQLMFVNHYLKILGIGLVYYEHSINAFADYGWTTSE